MATGLIMEPATSALNAMESDATDTGVSMAGALKRAREDAEIAKV